MGFARAPGVRSLRGHLLRLLLPPIAGLLALGAVVGYYPSVRSAEEAYDQALVDVGIAIRAHLHVDAGQLRLDLPTEVEQVLLADRYDKMFYRVLGPRGEQIAGEEKLPAPHDGAAAYRARLNGENVRVVTVNAPCGESACTVLVAETMVKRSRLARDVLVSGLLPGMLIALVTLVIVWFGVKRGLWPLARLSDELKERSPRDLRAIDVAAAPEETRPLVSALNGLLEEVSNSAQYQQRFLANAAHQLRTPLAGLRAHTELALAQPMPDACRAHLEQVQQATIRTARLANQLLALARAEPGARGNASEVDLKQLVEGEADAWVHQALARDVDLGFELASSPVHGDAFLLREALANLVHNAIEYCNPGGHVTVRTGAREGHSFAEVEDDGPGIAPQERSRVLERFYRVSGTPGTGSGLGLAIVREIATGHGGTVEIGAPEHSAAERSRGPNGCRVALTFPHG